MFEKSKAKKSAFHFDNTIIPPTKSGIRLKGKGGSFGGGGSHLKLKTNHAVYFHAFF